MIFTETESPTHISTGIARIKLGRVLLREKRYREAETESHAGYDILIKQVSPTANWLMDARNNLAQEFDALNERRNALQFREELTSIETASKTSAEAR